MVDVEIIREHLSAQAGDELMRIGRKFGRSTGEERQHFSRFPFRADRAVAQPGEVLDQRVDNAIPELLHLLGRKLQA
jgi:tetrahydromethanopterin S-methyltransferase subunit G